MADQIPELDVLPAPKQVRMPEHARASGVTAPPAVGSVQWTGVLDDRARLKLDELLGEPNFPLLIHIETRTGQYPSFGDDESYSLEVDAAGCRVAANTAWGALHGITTLWQLCVLTGGPPPACQIIDQPRFPWRGLLIDVARHFISLQVLRRVVDGMSRLKLNVLHLHLSDDQAFRFECQAFNKLASPDHYSQAELRDLIDYAAARGIRVVPELDVPGHVTSWLVNYPEWGLGQVAPTDKFGVHKACLNVADSAVYEALERVFGELCAVFEDEFVHIGGDEVHPAWWRSDTDIQAYIQQHELVDERGLQAHFNRRLCQLLNQQGRQVVAWDEVLHPDMPDLVVQNWRGATTRDRARALGQDTLMSCAYYLDLFYPADMHYRFDPEATQAELLELEDALRGDPRLAHVAEGLGWTEQWRDGAVDIANTAPDRRGRVLGGEACLWSELVDDDTLEVRLFSRLPAVAERFWSPAEASDLESFYRRLTAVLSLPGLDVAGLQARRLSNLGLSEAQIHIAALLEPVKWYARLLGEQALQARIEGQEMPQARPYDVHTPLNKVVDFLAPESLPARELAKLPRAALLRSVTEWQQLQLEDWPEDVVPVLAALKEIAGIMAALPADPDLRQIRSTQAQLEALYKPYGEYLPAVVPGLLKWLERHVGA